MPTDLWLLIDKKIFKLSPHFGKADTNIFLCFIVCIYTYILISQYNFFSFNSNSNYAYFKTGQSLEVAINVITKALGLNIHGPLISNKLIHLNLNDGGP